MLPCPGVGGLLAGLLLFLLGSIAPGTALAWLLLRDRDPLAVGTIGVVLGVFVLPSAYFALAMVLRTNVHPALIIGISAAILAIAGWRHAASRRRGAVAGGPAGEAEA